MVDAHRQVRHAPLRLVNEATYVGGRRADRRACPLRHRRGSRSPTPSGPPWPAASSDLRALLTAPLVGADGLAEQFPRPTPRSS